MQIPISIKLFFKLVLFTIIHVTCSVISMSVKKKFKIFFLAECVKISEIGVKKESSDADIFRCGKFRYVRLFKAANSTFLID